MFRSFEAFSDPSSNLDRCVVVCDGYKVKPENRFRSGQVTEECATKYEEFVRRLRLLAFGKMVRCADRMGFGFALKTALEHVRTPYVIVVQHDRNFVRAVEVERLVRAMEANAGWLKYLGLPTTTTMHHARHVVSKYNIRVEPRALDSESTDQVVPLVQWYDSTHICETRHYREFVYRGDLVKKGGFVEDKLGQRQLADIRDGGMAAHVPYGTFVLDDGLTQPMVSHLDSHDRLAYRKFSFVQRGKHDSDEDLMDRNISLPGQVLPDL